MNTETVKRRSKDSVFVDIFSDVNYVLELYKELHPEDTEVTADDINIQTIKSVLVNTLYNDLGFLVRDILVMLVEAQSVWNPNISLRLLIYLAETYRRYLAQSEQSEHSTSRVKLPRPELYVIYSGEAEVPEEISFAEDYFDGNSPVDIKIKILSRESADTISGQYIGFCKVFDEQRKIYDNRLECIKETLRICAEKNYLTPYLKRHEKEAFTMMSELFDEEYLRRQYDKAERKKVYAAGVAEGIEKGESRMKRSIAEKMREAGLTEELIKKITSV